MSACNGGASVPEASVPLAMSREEVLGDYFKKYGLKRSPREMIGLLVHGYVSDRSITAENVVETYKKHMQPSKSEYPIEVMVFTMNNESASILEIIRYFKNLRRGSFVPTILGNLNQANGFYTRVNEQRETVNLGTYKKDFYSPTIHKRNANYREHGPLYYEVRNPESVFDAFDRYIEKHNEEEDRIEGILTRLNEFKRDIKDFFNSFDQADFESFCRDFPKELPSFEAELDGLRDNLARIIITRVSHSDALNAQITKIESEIKEKEEKLSSKMKKYENREEIRTEYKHRSNQDFKENLYWKQADFERFCTVFPEKAKAFTSELDRLRANLARLAIEASSKTLPERMVVGGLYDQITKLKAEVKKKEQELATNTQKYEARQETRAEFHRRFNEEVRKINKLLEDANNFVVEVMK